MDIAGVDMAMSADAPITRKQAFRPAGPLEDHVVASLAVLKRVDTVRLTGGDKEAFEFTVQLHAEDPRATFRPRPFTIRRTAQQIDRLSRIVYDACCRHVELNHEFYDVPVCALCEPFKHKAKLPVRRADRLFLTTRAIQSAVEARVVALVRGATVPPTNAALFCEGVTRFPAAVTRFLLQGVDQTRLDR